MEIKIGFRFIFQSKDKTITDNEVDIEMDKIIFIPNTYLLSTLICFNK